MVEFVDRIMGDSLLRMYAGWLGFLYLACSRWVEVMGLHARIFLMHDAFIDFAKLLLRRRLLI